MYTHPDFVLRKVYGKALLMPVRKNNAGNDPIFLNHVACTIWELAAENLSKAELIDKIKDIYDIQSNSIEEVSIKSFLEELIDMHLIFE